MTQEDEKQLGLLATLHYVAAALGGLVPILGVAYAWLGAAVLLGKLPGDASKTPNVIGWLPVVLGMLVLVMGVAAVALNLMTARSLRDRKRHTLCVVASAINCMHFPLGTLLGAFTLVVVCRPAVRAAFISSAQVPPVTRFTDQRLEASAAGPAADA